MPVDPNIERTRDALKSALLAERTDAGDWEGELSSSALSTATATIALLLHARATKAECPDLARSGLAWIATHQNRDGGWGDTIDSPSNVSTTTLCWVALGIDFALAVKHGECLERAESCLALQVGGELTRENLTRTIRAAYGTDRTFSVPILTTCALGGRLGEGPEAWDEIPPLPFELSVLPHQLFHWLGLTMVSYALPALIAIGVVIHHRKRNANPLTRLMRRLARARALRVLTMIQPSSGGFLEATPLTSFVVLSLIGAEHADHRAVKRGLAFLATAVRPDGSWPIDTNLATWVTTLSIDALASGGRLGQHLDAAQCTALADRLLAQQYRKEHPYTHAAPGGWAWTDLPGGVPDADDTAGALLALAHLGQVRAQSGAASGAMRRAATAGVRWLAGLQNRDGGIPTFCKGWGKLPFDRSSPDLTAHALRAFAAWKTVLPREIRSRAERAQRRAVRYLLDAQREDGSWVPLWFGSQHAADIQNPLYGTSRVLKASDTYGGEAWGRAMERGAHWILAAQGADGGWGAAAGLPPSIEETAMAVEALCCTESGPAELRDAILRGAHWLGERTQEGTRLEPTPLGLYFARLWYSERLYPRIFATAALERACAFLSREDSARRSAAGTLG
ncbi:MAG: prenyltransferase/squalene oxidase repeat-containing protein [Planctomycetota bacterium]